MASDPLDTQLREVQKMLSKPRGKIVGTLGYLVNFLNPLGRNGKNNNTEEKKSKVSIQKHNDITWIDIENPKHKEINQLAQDYPFHPLHLEACLLKGQLDRIEKEEKYIFLLLHDPNYHAEENKIVSDQICIFLGKNYLITIHDDSIITLPALFKECEEDKEKQETLFKRTSGYLLYNIVDYLIKDIAILLQTVIQEVDEIEDLVFDIKVSGAYKISQLRQKIVRLRRVTSSLRNIMQELSSSSGDLVENMTRYFKNLTNEVNKLWETLEEARETVEIYKDADFTMSTDRTNKILGILTIIFTLSIPATIIGAFYGMNILLPGGLEAGPWDFWGPYTTFYIVMGSSTTLIILMLIYFKYKNWF